MFLSMSGLPKRFFTPEEYLLLELNAAYKSQYLAGEIFAMAGAQPWHNEVLGNIFAGLHQRLRSRGCRVYFADMRLRVKAGDLYTYPDLMALCGEPKFEGGDNPQSLLNPQLIVEVLSPSTEAFDRGDKFARCRLLDSLEDYVLASSERMRVEHYSRQEDGSWKLQEFQRAEETLSLSSVNCALPLAEIYADVTFPAPGLRG